MKLQVRAHAVIRTTRLLIASGVVTNYATRGTFGFLNGWLYMKTTHQPQHETRKHFSVATPMICVGKARHQLMHSGA